MVLLTLYRHGNWKRIKIRNRTVSHDKVGLGKEIIIFGKETPIPGKEIKNTT
jgi:hypothetical protein